MAAIEARNPNPNPDPAFEVTAGVNAALEDPLSIGLTQRLGTALREKEVEHNMKQKCSQSADVPTSESQTKAVCDMTGEQWLTETGSTWKRFNKRQRSDLNLILQRLCVMFAEDQVRAEIPFDPVSYGKEFRGSMSNAVWTYTAAECQKHFPGKYRARNGEDMLLGAYGRVTDSWTGRITETKWPSKIVKAKIHGAVAAKAVAFQQDMATVRFDWDVLESEQEREAGKLVEDVIAAEQHAFATGNKKGSIVKDALATKYVGMLVDPRGVKRGVMEGRYLTLTLTLTLIGGVIEGRYPLKKPAGWEPPLPADEAPRIDGEWEP